MACCGVEKSFSWFHCPAESSTTCRDEEKDGGSIHDAGVFSEVFR